MYPEKKNYFLLKIVFGTRRHLREDLHTDTLHAHTQTMRTRTHTHSKKACRKLKSNYFLLKTITGTRRHTGADEHTDTLSRTPPNNAHKHS